MSEPSSEEPVTILLVEDNPGDVRLTREAFDSIDCEVEFHVATDGGEAVKYVQRHFAGEADPPPDVILLDLNLPRVNGFDVLEFMHEELDSPRPPVLILSSSDAEEDIDRSYRKGCNAYLTKPDDMGEFASLARSIKEFWLDLVEHPQLQS